jgi:hypothetical protein
MSDDHDEDHDLCLPLGVRIAGWIWIGIGGLMLAVTLVMVVSGGIFNVGALTFCGIWLLAIAFCAAVAGIRTVRGTAEDTIGNGIASIALGIVELVLAFAIGLYGRAGPGGLGEALLFGGLLATQGLLLLAAGTLALCEHRNYQNWRAANRPHEAVDDATAARGARTEDP